MLGWNCSYLKFKKCHLGIYKEGFIFFDGYGYMYLTVILFNIPLGSTYHARTFAPM